MKKIVHLISDLDTGGAEMMLCKLVKSMDRTRFENVVVSMKDMGSLGEVISASGVRVYTLGMSRGFPKPSALWALVKILRKERPRILQTWLYHADLLGLAAGRTAGVPVILWNLRCSDVEMRNYSPLSALVLKMLARLSSFPHGIITNSTTGKEMHEKLGYRCSRWELIPNGFETDRFQPRPGARARLRDELGLPEDSFLIGLVARYDPMKDHENFLRAADILMEQYQGGEKIFFVLAGRGVDDSNQTLTRQIEKSGVKGRVHLLGERDDIPVVSAALDIMSSSSSYGEGFPNVIGEAMACGVPCVVTDVGDSAYVVGETGIVIPPRDYMALAGAWMRLLSMDEGERQSLGRAARERTVSLFSISGISRRYEKFYREISGN